MVDRLPSLSVPDQRGLALVGNPQGRDLPGRDAGAGQGLARCGELQAPDFQRVMLHPAGLGIDLRQLFLRHGHGLAAGIKHDAAAAGGALVQGEQVGHGGLWLGRG